MDAENEDEHKHLTHKDYVTMYVGGPGGDGFATVGSFNDTDVTVFTTADEPPNFERSCVFQILSLEPNAKPGTPIRFGNRVMLVHRLTQKAMSQYQDSGWHLRLRNAPLDKDGNPTGQLDVFSFRLLPRIKLYADGAPIQWGSQILFDCDIQGHQKIRVAFSKDQSVLATTTAKSTGIRLRLFAAFGSTANFGSVLKGGDFVRLIHQEHDALLEVIKHEHEAGNEHNAKNFGFISEDETLCLRKLPDGIDMADFHGANSLWQIELQDINRGGRPVVWGEPVKFKNVLSDCYLDIAAKTTTGAQGVSTSADRTCLVSLAPPDGTVIDSGGAVKFTDPFYIRGVDSGWLHAGVATEEEAVDTSEVDKTTFVDVQFVDTKRDEDAFNISWVNLKDIQEFSRAKTDYGIIREMQDMTDMQIQNLLEHQSQFQKFSKALDSLIKFCTQDDPDLDAEDYDGDAITYNQNILVDLRVPDCLMGFVSRCFDRENRCISWTTFKGSESSLPWSTVVGKFGAFNKLARKCFRVLRQMSKDNKHTGFLIATAYKIEITNMCRLLAHANTVVHWGIPEALEEMFRENELLLRDVDADYIRTFSELIHDAKDIDEIPFFFELLASFCTHDGDAIPEIQDAVTDAILDVMPAVRIHNQELEVEFRTPTPGKPYKDWLVSFKPCPVDSDKAQGSFVPGASTGDIDSGRVKMITGMLHLMGQVCFDRHHSSQNKIKARKISFEVALAGLSGVKIHPKIRAQFAIIMHRLFVDVDPLENVQHNFNRSWRDLKDDAGKHDTIIKLKNAVPSHNGWSDELIAWSLAYFSEINAQLSLHADHDHHTIKPLSTSQRDELERRMHKEMEYNDLTHQVLILIDDMVKLGFFSGSREKHRLLQSLLQLLHASASDTANVGKESSHSHKIVTHAKTTICDVLVDLLEIRASDAISELLGAFKTVFCKKNPHADHDAQASEAEEAHQHHHLDPHFDSHDSHHPLSKAYGTIGDMLWFHSIKIGDSKGQRRATLSHKPGMHFAANKPSQSAEALTNEEFVYLMLELCEYPDDSLRSSALKLLLYTFNLKGVILERMDEVIITADKQETELLGELKTRLTKLTSETHRSLTGDVLHDMIDNLHWFESKLDDGHSLHADHHVDSHSHIHMHQEMMRHTRVHKAVLKFLEEQLSGNDKHIHEKLHSKELKTLFSSCFHFLALFVFGNQHNQGDMMSVKTFHFLVHCTKFNINAEDTLACILSHEEAEEHFNQNHVRVLVENLYNHAECRSASYFRMLQKSISPGNNLSESHQINMIDALLHGRSQQAKEMALFGNQSGPGASIDFIFQVTAEDELKKVKIADYGKQIRKAGIIKSHSNKNGMQFEYSFRGKALCDLLVAPPFRLARSAAVQIGNDLITTGLLYNVEDDVYLSDFEDGASLYRFREDVESSCHDHHPGTKEAICETLLECCSMLSICSEGNPSIAEQLEKELPFSSFVNTFKQSNVPTGFESAVELPIGFAQLPMNVKSVLIKLCRNIHLSPVNRDQVSLTEEEISQLQLTKGQNEIVDGFGFTNVSAGSSVGVDQLVCISDMLVSECKAQYQRLQRAKRRPDTLGENFVEKLAEVDKYYIHVLTPISIGILHHSIKVLQRSNTLSEYSATETAHCTQSFTALCNSLAEYYSLRKSFQDGAEIGVEVDPTLRAAGTKHLHELFDMAAATEFRLIHSVFKASLAKLEVDLFWWSGGEQREHSHATAVKRGKHTKKHSHAHHTRGGKKHTKNTRHKSKGPNLAVPLALASHHAPQHQSGLTEFVADELQTFRRHTKELMQKGHSPHDPEKLEWLDELENEELDFAEYWSLVHIIRTELIDHKASHDIIEKTESTQQHRQLASFNIDESFELLFHQFEHAEHTQAGEHVELDHEQHKLMLDFIFLLCAVTTADTAGYRRDRIKEEINLQRHVISKLNRLGLPKMVVFLASTKHSRTVCCVASLAVETIHASPLESAAEIDNMVHPHSQKAFYDFFVSDVRHTHHLLYSIKYRVTMLKEHLYRRQTASELQSSDNHSEDLESEALIRLIGLIRHVCKGCYVEMQNLFREQESTDSVNMIEVMVDLAHTCAEVIKSKQKLAEGEGLPSSDSRHFVHEALKFCDRELHDMRLVSEVYETLSELVSGPNRANQEQAVAACQHMLPVLQYMERNPQAGTSIDDVQEFIDNSLSEWMDYWEVMAEEDNAGHVTLCDQDDDVHPEKELHNDELKEVTTVLNMLGRLDKVDETCEMRVMEAIYAVLEGREAGHEIYTQVCQELIRGSEMKEWMENSAVNLQASVLGHNLHSHYETHLMNKKDHEALGRDYDTAVDYYILIQMLASSTTYRDMLRTGLRVWDKQNSHPFEGQIGRVEFVLNGVLTAIYFQIPNIVKAAQNTSMVLQVKADMLRQSYLLNIQDRIRFFLSRTDLVKDVIIEQSRYHEHPVLTYLTRERLVMIIALLLSAALNVLVIAEYDSKSIVWTILGFSYLAMSIILFFGYSMNHLVVDRFNFHQEQQHFDLASLPTKILGAVGFWVFQTQWVHRLASVGFAALGVFYHYGFFVLGLYDLLIVFPTLTLIQKAIQNTAQKLLSTTLLAFLVLFTLAVFGQVNFAGEYTFSINGDISCVKADAPFVNCLRDHIYTFGQQAVFEDEIPSVEGFIFAVFYNLFVVFMLTGIFVGVITDSFGLLRQEAEDYAAAVQGYCYVCSHSRSELDSACVNGFEGHTKQEHDPWAYIAFRFVIDEKIEKLEHLSGPELIYYKKLQDDQGMGIMDLWPMNRALAIDGTKSDPTQDPITLLEQRIERKFAALTAQFNEQLNPLLQLAGNIERLVANKDDMELKIVDSL